MRDVRALSTVAPLLTMSVSFLSFPLPLTKNAVRRHKCRVHQSGFRHIPLGPVQPDEWTQGGQLQENREVRLQAAGQ